jgi:hypothetical protein
LKSKLIYILSQKSVHTAKKTQLFTITKINWLTLLKEIIDVLSENRTKHINTLRGQNAELLFIEAGGTYSYTGLLKVDVSRLINVCCCTELEIN